MEFFIFSLIRVYGSLKIDHTAEALRRRGIDMERFRFREEGSGSPYPSLFQLIFITLSFWMAVFHKRGCEKEVRPPIFPTETEIQELIASVEVKISKGLGLHRDLVESLDYEELENRLPRRLLGEIEDGGLLKAVAAVVAEAGPWNASMDMVARRSGLSKSGLYAHFKNKQDMIRQLFQTEFERLADYAEAGNRCSDVPAERFYLTILSIADYLRSRPEILIAMDWLKTRRLDLGLSVPSRIYGVLCDFDFAAPKSPANPNSSGQTAHWILFLIVNALMRRPAGMAFSELPDHSIRRLFRFIGLGVGGFKI
jgi:AcrR family transcriptional regulator